jgi:hypothetical protein
MRPLTSHTVREGNSTTVYVALASASDIPGDPDYLYGHLDPGVMDAYRLVLAPDGAYTMTAKGLGLPFGTAGDCGCASAKFVQAGPRTHGWMFSAGGTWQGMTVAFHSLVAPVGDEFRDVAGVPRFREDDPRVEYRVDMAPASGDGDWYPLRISRIRDGRHEATRDVAFDPRTERYPASIDF